MIYYECDCGDEFDTREDADFHVEENPGHEYYRVSTPDRQWEEHYRTHSSSITGIVEGI